MEYTPESFLAAIKPYVLEDMRKSGILASLTGAQALIESRSGNSGLTQKANNLFGIKGTYQGQSVKMLTTEYDSNGKAYKTMADFRKYPSWTESIADHSAMFNRLKRYANLRGCTDWKQACKNVEADGYATAKDPKTGKPNYANTLLNAIETHKLYKWDQEVLSTAGASTSAVFSSTDPSSGSSTDDKPATGNPYPEPTKNVKFGSRGNDVRWCQFALNTHGYHLIVDGIAKELTILAIRDFQERNSLVADGICGPLTREKLKK